MLRHMGVSWGDIFFYMTKRHLVVRKSCHFPGLCEAALGHLPQESLMEVLQASAFLPAVGIGRGFGKWWTPFPPLRQYTKRWFLS